MTATLLFVCATLVGPAQLQDATEPSVNRRVAALRFAINNGFEIPPSDLVVAAELGFQRGRARNTTLSVEELMSEAREIAGLVGPFARIGWAADHVLCPESRCYAATGVQVLIVEPPSTDPPGTPHAGGSNVYIKLYSPAVNAGDHATLYQAVVRIEALGTGWVGAGFTTGPNRINVR